MILTTPDGPAVHAREARAVERRSGTSWSCAAATKGSTSACAQALATEEMSIGDYVLSGGELPALVIVDAVARLVPGVVGDEESVARDSFARGLLDFPQYTRPAEFRGHGGAAGAAVGASRARSSAGGGARRCGGRWSGGRICWSDAQLDAEDRRLLQELLEQR